MDDDVVTLKAGEGIEIFQPFTIEIVDEELLDLLRMAFADMQPPPLDAYLLQVIQVWKQKDRSERT